MGPRSDNDRNFKRGALVVAATGAALLLIVLGLDGVSLSAGLAGSPTLIQSECISERTHFDDYQGHVVASTRFIGERDERVRTIPNVVNVVQMVVLADLDPQYRHFVFVLEADSSAGSSARDDE